MTLALFGRTFNPKALTLLREEQGLSKAKLGMMIGAGNGNAGTNKIASYEKGKRQPSVETIHKLVEALDCYLEDLAPRIPGAMPKEIKYTGLGGTSKEIREYQPRWHWED